MVDNLRTKRDFDLVVIGGGSAGVRASRVAGSLGAKVALIEERRLGGTCVNVGCVPKKLFWYGGHFAHEVVDAAGFGWTVPTPHFDWPTLRRNEEKEVARLNAAYRHIVESAHVEVIDGHAALEGQGAVRVRDRRITADQVIVATGSWPHRPSFRGSDLGLTSNDCFVLERLPSSMIIVGGGYIGLEFASVFAGLGVEITLVARAERVLPHFDRDVGLFVQGELAKQHIRVLTGTTLTRIERRGTSRVAVLSDGNELVADEVLLAVGRDPLIEGLGLDRLGIKQKADGAILVDDRYCTGVAGVYAIGDVIGHAQLTPVALAEGTALARTLFGGAGPVAVDYGHVPTAVFTMPEVACVGLSEAHARTRYGDATVFRTDFRPLKHTVSGSTERMFMKLVVDPRSDRVVGAHLVGSGAAEILQGVAIAMVAGATKAQFDATLGIHPTSAEELVTMRTPVTA